MTSAMKFIDEPDTIRNEIMDNGLLVTNNRMTESVSYRKVKTLLTEFLCEYQDILLSPGIKTSEAIYKQNELINEYAEHIERTIVAILGNERIYKLQTEVDDLEEKIHDLCVAEDEDRAVYETRIAELQELV